MKIKRFVAKNVNGYINYDVNFKNDLTFLIGLNGCGKTTALKLISGLLTPNYFYLVQTRFSEIELVLSNNDKEYHITAKQTETQLNIELNNEIKENYTILPRQRIDELLYDPYLDETEVLGFIRKFYDSKYTNKIHELIKPIILGLSRRVSESPRNDIDRIQSFSMRRRYARSISRYEGVDQALAEIKELLHDKVRENANKREVLSNNFREELLMELTKLSDASSTDSVLKRKGNFKKDLEELKNKRTLLNSIIPSLKIPALKDSFDVFFDKLESILNRLLDANRTTPKENSEELFNLVFEWMISSYQLNNVDKIIQIGQRFSKKIEELDIAFNRLKNSLNLFFKETNKEVDINGEGDLLIKIKDKTNIERTNSIFELSSGEKQLIVLFSQLAFAQDSKKDVFIIDEPELSLHLTWQEKFVDALQEACPEMQFILATHAPAIVNDKNKLNHCINLSKTGVQ